MKLAALALVILASVGCSQAFYVETDPPGAEVWIGGKYKGTTPLTCKVTGPNAFSGPLEVMAKKEGYLGANAFTDWHMTWTTSRVWTRTNYFLKLSKFEPAPSASAKPGE